MSISPCFWGYDSHQVQFCACLYLLFCLCFRLFVSFFFFLLSNFLSNILNWENDYICVCICRSPCFFTKKERIDLRRKLAEPCKKSRHFVYVPPLLCARTHNILRRKDSQYNTEDSFWLCDWNCMFALYSFSDVFYSQAYICIR